MKRVVFAAMCAAAIWSTGSSVPDGYAVRRTFTLKREPDQMSGRLELLEDARIRVEMRSAIRDAYGGDPCAGQPPIVLKSLCVDSRRAAQLRPALLRLLDDHGRVIAQHSAERSLAELAPAQLYGTRRRTFLFTVDLSAGVGSYSGPYTRLAEPNDRGFGWLTADSAGVARDTITLVSTLKTAWQRRPRSDGRGDDLLMVMCRPDFTAADSANDRFVLTFKRWSFDDGRWVLRQRQERGCYESDEQFPPVTRFP